MASRWGPGIVEQPQRDQWGELGDALLSAADIYTRGRDRKAAIKEREQQRLADQEYRNRVLAGQDADRADRKRLEEENLARERARLAQQGILFRPGADQVYEQTGERITLPEMLPGTGPVRLGGVRAKPGMRVLGGGYYEDAARTPTGRAAAVLEEQRKKQRAALIARGYTPQDAELIIQGTVNATDVGPLAEEANRRDIGRYRATVLARELEGQADGNLKPVDAARMVDEYDEGTNQQLRLADQLTPSDPLWRPRTAADSARVVTRDSLRTEAQGRMTNRPTTPSLLGLSRGGRMSDLTGGNPAPPAPTPAPAATKTPAQWVSEVRKEHPDWTADQVAAEARKRAGQ